MICCKNLLDRHAFKSGIHSDRAAVDMTASALKDEVVVLEACGGLDLHLGCFVGGLDKEIQIFAVDELCGFKLKRFTVVVVIVPWMKLEFKVGPKVMLSATLSSRRATMGFLLRICRLILRRPSECDHGRLCPRGRGYQACAGGPSFTAMVPMSVSLALSCLWVLRGFGPMVRVPIASAHGGFSGSAEPALSLPRSLSRSRTKDGRPWTAHRKEEDRNFPVSRWLHTICSWDRSAPASQGRRSDPNIKLKGVTSLAGQDYVSVSLNRESYSCLPALFVYINHS